MSHWSSLSTSPLKKSPEMKEGIISTEKPVPVKISDEYKIENTNTIHKSNVALLIKETKLTGKNIILPDNLLSTVIQGYIFNLFKDTKLVGTVVSIQNRIKLNLKNSNDFIEFKSSLTTNLVVDNEERNKSLAMSLIKSAINKGYEDKIYTGYHYMPDTKRTGSGIKVMTWFRVLDFEKSIKLGYDIENINKVSEEEKIKIMKKGNIRYSIQKSTKELKIIKTLYTDLEYLKSAKRRLIISIPTQDEFKILSAEPLKWATVKEGKYIRGIIVYRPINIYLADSGNLSKSLQLIFFESDPESAFDCINSFMQLKKEEGYIALYGATTGSIVALESKLRLMNTNAMYLDFYNLHIEKLQPEDVSLLYI